MALIQICNSSLSRECFNASSIHWELTTIYCDCLTLLWADSEDNAVQVRMVRYSGTTVWRYCTVVRGVFSHSSLMTASIFRRCRWVAAILVEDRCCSGSGRSIFGQRRSEMLRRVPNWSLSKWRSKYCLAPLYRQGTVVREAPPVVQHRATNITTSQSMLKAC